MKKAVILFGTIIFIAGLSVTGCFNPMSAPESGVGYVSLSIPGVVSQTKARTVLPSSFDFDSYKLEFTKEGGGSENVSFETLPEAIPLAPGTWDLTLTAYIGEANEGNIAATGTTTGIEVTDGNVTPVAVDITFSSSLAGTGTLSWDITKPASITPAEAKIVLKKLDTSATDIEIDLSSVYTGTRENIAAGYYWAVVTLATTINGNADKKAVWGDVVHIYKNQTTAFAHQFAETDFNRVIDKIWLVGSMAGDWALPGAVMTKSDGTFTWAGDVSANATFRFSLTDTTGWEEVWKGDWFAPETNNTSVENPTYPMEFITNYAGTNNAWKFPNAGYYTITVDPGTLQMTIAKPIIVETVTITGGDIPLPTDTTSHQFYVTVAGKNDPPQAVTWSVTGNTSEGTTITETGGTLSIAADETAETLTVTATSTADTAKSGSITVTVSSKTQLTAVTTPALSAQGVATWSGESDDEHVEKYTVALYKAGESEEPAEQKGTAEVSRGGTYSHDFFSDIETSGPGSYYITVTAKAASSGDYLDANPSAPSTSQTFTRRAGVQFVWWEGTEAQWVDPDASGNYEVQLYKLVSGAFAKEGGVIPVDREGHPHKTDPVETKTNHDFGATLNNGEVYAFTVTTKGTRPVLDGEPSALPVQDANGVPIVYSSSAYNKVVYQWTESNLGYFDIDGEITSDWTIPSGKTLVIKAGKTLTLTGITLTAGNIKLGPGVWKASEADVSITANTVTLGSHAYAGFGNGDGGQSAVLTGQLGAANTFTASGGVITLGQDGNNLSVTGDTGAVLALGTSSRFYVKGNQTLTISGGVAVDLGTQNAKIDVAKDGTVEIATGSKIVAGPFLELTAGTWKATGGESYTWTDIPPIDTNVYIAVNGIHLGNSRKNKFGKDGGAAATTLAAPIGDNKWAAGSSYTASGAKVTIGQNGNNLTITGEAGAKLTTGASGGFFVKAGLIINNVTLDMSVGNDWESVIYLAPGSAGLTLENSNSVLLFNNDSEGGGTYFLEYNSSDINSKITIGSSVVVKAIWNNSWRDPDPEKSQNNERFASFTGAADNNTITRKGDVSETDTIWLTKNLKFKD